MAGTGGYDRLALDDHARPNGCDCGTAVDEPSAATVVHWATVGGERLCASHGHARRPEASSVTGSAV